MNLIEVEQVFDAYNNYISTRNPDKLKTLKTQNKPKFKEYEIILNALIPELKKMVKDKKTLAEAVKSLSGNTRRGKMIIQFIMNSDLISSQLKGELVALEQD